MRRKLHGLALPIGLLAITLGLSGCDLDLDTDRASTSAAAEFEQVSDDASELTDEERKNLEEYAALVGAREDAEAACGSRSLTGCQQKGRELFESIPDTVRGDPNVPTQPAGVMQELDTLDENDQLDNVGKLERAVQLVNALTGLKDALSRGIPMDQAAASAQLFDMFPNATQDDLLIGSTGEHAVNFDLNAEERGTAAFSQRTLKTAPEVGAFLQEATPEATAARANVEKSIREMYGETADTEIQRALSGACYIPFQLTGASQVLGTTYFKDGQVLTSGAWRQAGSGDVYWLCFGSDGRLIKGATVRADCGNPGVGQIMVVRPNTPPAPPVDTWDECPAQPGDQPPGYPCSKVGQIGSIAAGNHDPLGGRPDPARNPTEPTAEPRPEIVNRDTPGRVVEPAPVATTPPTVVVQPDDPEPEPTVVPEEQPVNDGVVDDTPDPGTVCVPNAEFGITCP